MMLCAFDMVICAANTTDYGVHVRVSGVECAILQLSSNSILCAIPRTVSTIGSWLTVLRSQRFNSVKPKTG